MATNLFDFLVQNLTRDMGQAILTAGGQAPRPAPAPTASSPIRRPRAATPAPAPTRRGTGRGGPQPPAAGMYWNDFTQTWQTSPPGGGGTGGVAPGQLAPGAPPPAVPTTPGMPDQGLQALIAALTGPAPADPGPTPGETPVTPPVALSPELTAFGQWLQAVLSRRSAGAALPGYAGAGGGGGGMASLPIFGMGPGVPPPSSLLGPAFYQTQRQSVDAPRALPSGVALGYGSGGLGAPAFPSLTGPGRPSMTPGGTGQGYLPSPTRLV